MITDKIIQIIEKLRHNTSSRLEEVQESKVPAIYKMKSEIQQTYFMDGQEYVYNAGKLILLIKNLPIYYNLKRTMFEDYIGNMVNNKELNPFLIFLNGKFVKWSNLKLIHDFKDRYIVVENFDLASCYVPASKTESMQSIFSNWIKFSHSTQGIFPASATEMNSWVYDPAIDSVKCTINSSTYIGFISDKMYDTYEHQLTVASTDGDDDVIGTVIAFYKDGTGKEHTLSAIRCTGSVNGGISVDGAIAKWIIVYNFGQSNQKLIANGNATITAAPSGGWASISRGCTIKIERTETTVTATTSQFNSNILDPNTILTVDLNSEPVLQVFIGPKQYGYSCLSQNLSYFKDISFIDLKDNIVLPEAEMVTLPFNIQYKENQTTLSTKNIFAFDQSGFCVYSASGPMSTVDLDDPYIYYESNYLTPGRAQSTGINANYKISKINPLIFKNGKLYTDADIKSYGLNTFLVDDGSYYTNAMRYKLFYYIYGNQSKDNILNVANRSTAISQITGSSTIPSYYDTLSKDFDFSFDQNKTYEENINDALDYIVKYNPMLLDDVYKDTNKIECKQYMGSYILGLAVNGYVTMSRSNKGRLVNFPMIFVNGELYRYYHYTIYKGNNFTFPTMGITSTDKVEIVLFKHIDNRILQSVLVSSNSNDYYLDSNIDINDLRIFSRDVYNRTFDVPDTNYMRYPVEFDAERVSNSKMHITLKDSYYYDRKLYFTSARQFRYFYIISKDTNNNIVLPEEFAYCKNKANYMVFINGRRIDAIDFQFIRVAPNVPFEDTALYLRIPIKVNDKIDIFYVPEEMSEIVTMNTIPTTGALYVDKTKLPYSFDKDLYFVFMNGKKVNRDAILTINSHKSKIVNNIGTINNLTILKHAKDDEILNQLYTSNTNTYDTVIDSLTTTQLDSLFSGTTIGNTEVNIKTGEITNNDITKQIIRDYFLRTITTKVNSDELNDLITYDYIETIPYVEMDSDENILIK